MDMVIGFGRFAQNGTAATTSATGAYFQYDSSVSTNWNLVSRTSASNAATTTLSVGPAQNTTQILRGEVGSSSVRFLINGIFVGEVSGFIPSQQQDLEIWLQTQTASVRTVDIDYIWVGANAGRI